MPENPKEYIVRTFQQILEDRKAIASKVTTKTQVADQAKNQDLLQLAATYSGDRIVRGLANLQLEFGSIVISLSEKLIAEVAKLDTLERAIHLETEHLETLRQLRVVADALHIQTQEHQEHLNHLEQTTTERQSALEAEMTNQQQLWTREQQEFEATAQAKTERLTRERQRQTADYQYNFERTRTLASNEYEEKQRQQEQTLQATHQANEQQWAEREKRLAEQQPLLKTYQQKVDQFPIEMETSIQQAHNTAFETVQRDARVKAELVEKEWESTQKGYELKIQALDTQIQRQTQQMEQLQHQLQETLKQSYALNLKAFGNPGTGNVSGTVDS